MESTTGARSDQRMPPVLTLCVESYEEGTFNPDSDALDFLTFQVLSDVLNNNLHSRLDLKFFDADQVLVGTRRLMVTKISADLEIVSQLWTFARVPLRCEITDASGRVSERIFSEEEAREWISSPSFDGSYIDGRVFCMKKSSKCTDSPNFSSEVCVALHKMLIAAAVKELKPPLTIEIRDAQGRVFQAAEVQFNEHKYRVPNGLANCANVPFPVTVKLISLNGTELVTTVERPQ